MKTLAIRSLVVAFTVSVLVTAFSWLPKRVSVADPPIGMYEFDDSTRREAREKTQARVKEMSMFRYLVERQGPVVFVKAVLVQSLLPFMGAFVSCMWPGYWQAQRKPTEIVEPLSGAKAE